MKNTQVTKVCQKCGVEFKVKSYRADTAHYCSKACWSSRNPPQARQCAYCGKVFNSRDKRSIYCSRSCGRKALVGEKATAWKGGKAAYRRRSQYRGDLAKWRKAVFERDNYTCQQCGKKGDIHAHHIKPLAKFPDLALDVDNGLTLCVTCHESLHGRKFSTPSKYPKHCTDCGASTTGRSLYCRSCSIRHYHARHKADSNKTGRIPVC